MKGKYILLLGPDGVDSVGKLLGLGVVRQLALHPDQISEWSKSDGTVDGTLSATLVAVVTFTGTGGVPVPEKVVAENVLGHGADHGVALATNVSDEVGDGLLVLAGGLELLNGGLVEELEASLGHPLVFDGLKLSTILTSLLTGEHEVVQGLDIGVGGADDEGMVAGVDGGADEGGSFGVGSSNGKEIGS